ncbi:4-hydroxybenzoate solanesyltransferase [Oscillatoria sp. CS-180]|uniref:4-hydroxybenzoate solanesyltransferase n=1 Tax=Oscillatoria sp. CS-180 TaxID=3021720 RepID=UPI00232E45C7|nr:4-hydroxybenzoate solanesyltransferase [Oscillatoria sp. CS-180]MDB9525813.1 4-hydroxybenzoate solanesyltransferase [Oscillatoria sp. CS-180]
METPPVTRPEPIWKAVFRLMRWDKPTGRLILIVPALWSLFLAAQGKPPIGLLVVVVVGSLVTSAAGCIVNDLWDRDIDPQVKRTRNRPLASKALSVRIAIALALVAFLCAYGLTFYLNRLSFWLCVAAVPVIVLYPLAKRVFPVPQLVLAIAWGFAVLIPWAAVSGTLELSTWLLWGAVVLWTLGFDTVYAIPDREFDARLGVNSSARFFGQRTPLAVTAFFLGTAVLLVILGVVMSLGLPYWIAVAIAIVLWGREGYLLGLYNPPPSLYGRIFRQNVLLGFILLAGMNLSFWIS